MTLCSLQVVLAGGSCRIPRLQQLLQEQLPSAQHLLSLPPPEVVAVGAALEAGLLTGRDVGQAPHPQLQCTAADLWIAVCPSELLRFAAYLLQPRTQVPSTLCIVSPQCSECEEPCATLLLARHAPLPCRRRASLFLRPRLLGAGQVTVEVREGTAHGKPAVKVRKDAQLCSVVHNALLYLSVVFP